MEVARLIINADDFGLTEPINRGIIESIENGIVNSVSLIANGPELKSACEYLRSNPNIFKGWHINLTSGKPVLAPVKIKSLVNGKGYFLGKNRFRYGFLGVDDKHSEGNLMKGLEVISASVQRDQLRRLAGIA